MPPRDMHMPSERVTSDLRGRIEADQWAPGETLPTVTELSGHYGVSRATVSKALAVLSDEGVLVTQPRWGTFVADSDNS